MNFGRMETATGPGTECAHVTVFWPMKSCRQMSPGDRSENKKKSYFHCTVKIITSYTETQINFPRFGETETSQQEHIGLARHSLVII